MTTAPRVSLPLRCLALGALIALITIGANLPAHARCVTVGIDGNVQQVCRLP